MIVECVVEGVWIDTCRKSCYVIVHKSIEAFDNCVGKYLSIGSGKEGMEQDGFFQVTHCKTCIR